jgi:hypothetical protein
VKLGREWRTEEEQQAESQNLNVVYVLDVNYFGDKSLDIFWGIDER